ncbi:hypothetical protein J2T58_000412 [Methanocalculus alkaliphilus]|uniref:hypothetical protein n=1 Tax=Methanocalculus alkaliphilus TaxID=768730 RepID=UPI0020A232FB|nr:hypothetical protein [Methanocalculus alkaliphilus]MCP1714572.1 hypothetical protein [Methanocalculus alkaliphilus]
MSSESISMEDMKKEIDTLKKEIKKIKSNMIDPDSILTEEDYIFLQKYRKEKEKGQLLSESEVRNGLGL